MSTSSTTSFWLAENCEIEGCYREEEDGDENIEKKRLNQQQ